MLNTSEAKEENEVLNSMRKYSIQTGLLLIMLLSVSLRTLAQEATPTPLGPTLNAILSRRELICGVNQDLFGFGYLNPNTGNISGFDVDFCRAMAAAVLGDATLVNLALYPSAAAGEDALRKGDIDLLLHNVNWTLADDATDLTFGPVNFYDGDTAMVRSDASLSDWPDLDRGTICVVTGSTAESHVLPYMQGLNLTGNLLSVASLSAGQTALDGGQCDALSADVVQLSILRQRATDPQAYTVWQKASQFYTHEPFAPVMRTGDDQWSTLVEWTMLGLIQAEQLGITSENIDTKLRQVSQTPAETSADYVARVGPEVATFLDKDLGIGLVLGVQSNFMLAVIKQVGNYGEIYNRHLGTEAELPIERGINSLWKDGGLMYAPDWH